MPHELDELWWANVAGMTPLLLAGVPATNLATTSGSSSLLVRWSRSGGYRGIIGGYVR